MYDLLRSGLGTTVTFGGVASPPSRLLGLDLDHPEDPLVLHDLGQRQSVRRLLLQQLRDEVTRT